MDTQIREEIEALEKFKAQKATWFKLSFLVVIAVISLFLDWDYINQHNLQKYIVLCGLSISIAWWYWTMKIISKLLTLKKLETEILLNIVSNVNEIKKNVKSH